MAEHPTTVELARLLTGGLSHDHMRTVVRHLLGGCAVCRAIIAAHSSLLFPRPDGAAAAGCTAGRGDGTSVPREPASRASSASAASSATPAPPAAPWATLALLAPLPPLAPLAAKTAAAPLALPETRVTAAGDTAAARTELDSAYDQAIDRALASVVRFGSQAGRESKKIRQVLAALEHKGVAGFCELSRHLRGLAGYEALLARSWSLRYDDPQQMVQLCELATVVAAGLSAKRHGAERVSDLQARAAIELANAYRVLGRPDEAQASLNEALEFFRMGTQDRLMAARLFVIQAQVSGDRRSFDTALAAFDSAISIYRQHGEPYQVGDTLIKKGMYCGYACRPEEALQFLHQGLALIDATTHPELALLAVHNIANIMVDCAKYREARTLLWRHLPLYNRYGGRVLRLRLRLLEGRIHAGIDEPDRAERDLEEARRGFEEIGQPYMATLVLLDQAVLHLHLGRDEDARREAVEAADIFLTLSIGREAAVAMMLLKSTIKFRLATTTVLLEEMARFMRAAEHDPQLSFHSFLS